MSAVEQSAESACKNVAETDDTAAHVIVIALSAGGLVPVRRLLAHLPWNLPAAVVVAQHARGITYLPAILKPTTQLDVKLAESGDRLRCGHVYVSPPERHVVITPDARLQLVDRPRILHQPSADWLFESAAGSFAERTIAVILSGRMSDGARGALRIKRAGGYVFAQEPETCRFPDMPIAAILSGCVDAALSPDDIGPALVDVLRPIEVSRGRGRWREPFAAESV